MMSQSSNPQRVAVVGCGTIGASWAAFYLARGFDVAASDPAPGADRRLREFIDRVWPLLDRVGVAPGAARERLTFAADVAAAVDGAGFVQENGPEQEDLKVSLLAEIDAQAAPEVVIASSSSGLTMSVLQAKCVHPERCVIGHPFNPPHLIPLVEIVGGRKTSAETIERASAFYAGLGKKPVVLHREIPGHVANRLQAALWREAIHLVNEGVVSVAEVDDAVTWGPGLRWAVMGPNLIFHLGGGQGGMEHFLAHLSGPFAGWWNDLGQPDLTPDLRERLIAGVKVAADGRSIAELERQRDELIRQIVVLRAREQD